MPTSDVSFTASEVVVISAMLGVVIGALSWMFRLLLAAHEARRRDVADEREKSDQREKAAFELVKALEPVLRRNTESVAELLALWRDERRRLDGPR